MSLEERPGKYHKDRHRPSAWYNAPLAADEGEALYIRFCETFRTRHWKQECMTRAEWDMNAVRVFEDASVFDLPTIAAQPRLWVFGHSAREVHRATPEELRVLPPTLDGLDLYFVPENFAWCLCHTHDPRYWLYDPNGWFSDAR